MNPTIKNIHASADSSIAKALAQSGDKPPCCKGCFYCCKEPVYAALSEVQNMVESLTPEQRDQLKQRALKWLDKFKAAGMAEQGEPNVIDYREHAMWCPFLFDGLCTVYEHRPLACRLHLARKTVDGCAEDKLRAKQQYIQIQGLAGRSVMKLIQDLPDGGTEIMDHLGVLIAKVLLGIHLPTKVVIYYEMSGDTLIIKTHFQGTDALASKQQTTTKKGQNQ